MKIAMTVFSVDSVTHPVAATLPDGSAVQVMAPAVRVQLVHDTHGTLALMLTGDEAAEARETLQPGAAITLTLEV